MLLNRHICDEAISHICRGVDGELGGRVVERMVYYRYKMACGGSL